MVSFEAQLNEPFKYNKKFNQLLRVPENATFTQRRNQNIFLSLQS